MRQEIPRQVARGLLRQKVGDAAAHARDEAGFFARLRETGVLVRLRFSEIDPGQVTGYAIALSGLVGEDRAPLWYGGGRLAPQLTLPRLRTAWARRSGEAGWKLGTPWWAGSEREALYRHAARQAAAAAEHIRHSARGHPTAAADTAWAAADALHSAARALRDPELRRAADAYHRAARPPYGRIPLHTRSGDRLRATARLLALVGNIGGDGTLAVAALVASLLDLAAAVTELRQAQQHAAQAAAARRAAEHLHRAHTQARSRAAQPGWAARPEPASRATAPGRRAQRLPWALPSRRGAPRRPRRYQLPSSHRPYRRSVQTRRTQSIACTNRLQTRRRVIPHDSQGEHRSAAVHPERDGWGGSRAHPARGRYFIESLLSCWADKSDAWRRDLDKDCTW